MANMIYLLRGDNYFLSSPKRTLPRVLRDEDGIPIGQQFPLSAIDLFNNSAPRGLLGPTRIFFVTFGPLFPIGN